LETATSMIERVGASIGLPVGADPRPERIASLPH